MTTQGIQNLDVDVIEEPGTGLNVAQCPYCSRGFPEHNEEMEINEIPRTCRRCGAPMDYEEVHKPNGFADQKAEEAAKSPPRLRRNRMVDSPPVKKGAAKEED